MQAEYDSSSPDVMRMFYQRLYPFKSLFQWLNHEHAPSKMFTHREFAFTLPGDIYLRYNSFTSVDELKKQVVKLNPSRFEIGAVYTAMPRDRKTLRPGILQPTMRELVFDIDMTDYDAIRTCCSGKGICRRCWGFIAAAVDVLDAALREQFGFRHLLWVYSGRRGIHLWISDAQALALTDEERKALMGWLEVVKGGKDQTKKVNVRFGKGGYEVLHPALRSALDHLKNSFNNLILADQDCFAEEDGYKVLLELIPDKSEFDIRTYLQEDWAADLNRTSSEKWNDIKRGIKRETKDNDNKKTQLLAALEDIILQYTYPRLDAEVSKHRNHLLKAPFCVHPSTGRVCVPVDPVRVHEFEPENVPTVGKLLQELSDIPANGQEHHSDWEKTSLKPYVDMLDRHVIALMSERRQTKKEQSTSQSSHNSALPLSFCYS
ncbi:prim-pol domain-containing protein [Hysterangium stoloniferum]|nr:prim-pol domain-containing protein [Hysterangium stoloniferum]